MDALWPRPLGFAKGVARRKLTMHVQAAEPWSGTKHRLSNSSGVKLPEDYKPVHGSSPRQGAVS